MQKIFSLIPYRETDFFEGIYMLYTNINFDISADCSIMQNFVPTNISHATGSHHININLHTSKL